MKKAITPRPRGAVPPHTITFTVPAELGDLVQAGMAVRDAKDAVELMTAMTRLHGALSALLRKRK